MICVRIYRFVFVYLNVKMCSLCRLFLSGHRKTIVKMIQIFIFGSINSKSINSVKIFFFKVDTPDGQSGYV